jgi:hypothetical protein
MKGATKPHAFLVHAQSEANEYEKAPSGEEWGERRRLRRERDRQADARAQAFREAQERIPPCSYCGREAGQVAMPNGARIVFHCPEDGPELEGTPVLIETGPHAGEPVITRPYAGGWGCRHCEAGLPGEMFPEGVPETIRIIDAPSREEVEGWHERGGA